MSPWHFCYVGLRQLRAALAATLYLPYAVAFHCESTFVFTMRIAMQDYLRTGAKCCCGLTDPCTYSGATPGFNKGGELTHRDVNGGAFTRKSTSDGTRRLQTLSDKNKRLRRKCMCIAKSIATRSLLIHWVWRQHRRRAEWRK